MNIRQLTLSVTSLSMAFCAMPLTQSLAADPPEVRRGTPQLTGDEVLKLVRMSQALQDLKHLNGVLRNDETGQKTPFDLSMAEGSIRFVFRDPPEVINLDLKGVPELRRVTSGRDLEIPKSLGSETVRNTSINYEDLSMRFLYWPHAKLLGDDTVHFRKCWHVRIPAPDNRGPYGTVDVWVDQGSGGILMMEAYDAHGKKVKQFKVISGQKLPGKDTWILKEMRVESYDPNKGDLKGRTYMDIKTP